MSDQAPSVVFNVLERVEIVNSSNIKAISRTDTEGLVVTFLNGSEYLYKSVPSEVFESMAKAESVGKFLNANIKNKFEYIQLPKPEPKEKV